MEDQNQTDKSDKAIETDEEYIGLKRSQITHFREVIEATAKVLVGVSVLSYIIGLLITNMHLRKYGSVSEFLCNRNSSRLSFSDA